ncbi:MAG: gluconate 2-dehydrogenase subunit 3 family protein [Gemmatimonadota bacterium]
MSAETVSRRAFLAAAGASLGSAWLAAQPGDLAASLIRAADARRAAQRGEPLPPCEVLTPEQAADIEAIAAQIVPTDDLPGARAAHVLSFVDHSLATWAQNQRQPLLDGLAQFNTAVSQQYPGMQRFAQLTNDQQIEFLRANERNRFFRELRFATLIGMFSNPANGGNFEKAGYRVLGYDDRYVWRPPFGWYDDKANGGPN